MQINIIKLAEIISAASTILAVIIGVYNLIDELTDLKKCVAVPY